jgi:hypothetical protein
MADAFEAYNRLRDRASGLQDPPGDTRPLTITRASLRPGSTIPPRRWLYGTMLVRGYISVVIAPGGVGKTSWATAVGASVAQGRGLLGEHVHSQANVLMCNLEDPEDEFDRRLAACMIHHRLDEEDLAGRLFTLNGRFRRLVLAALDQDGTTIAYPDKDALIAQIDAEKIGLVVVDPFINSHELEENSNPQINAAARAWAEIADSTGCAVLLIHHTRKGATAGDMDGGRGASALMGAARTALTLTAMTTEEAAGFDIPECDRRRHVRLDDAKANLAPPADKARWLRLASVNLGNEDQDYPFGDNVQAIEVWAPPSVWKMSDAECNATLDVIAAGPGSGVRYTSIRGGRGPQNRWAGRVLMRNYGLNETQANKMLVTWLNTGLLEESSYMDPEQRKMRQGLIVNDDRRPG